ncbi:MAG: undecaprenyl-diphosphatase [Candidatus Aminicenantes bacterium]|nr:undecaprenyl-diphosphatase [Candidatus Aminicenantes bacterium]
MSLIKIIFLGFIQGITEFFPVSSSGHLVLIQNLLGLKEPQLLVDVMLHLGTVISLLLFLRKEIKEIITGLFRFLKKPSFKNDDPSLRLVCSLLIASIPTFLMGYFFSPFFESLFSSPRAVSAALFITAVFLFLTRYAKQRKVRIPIHPFIIGVLQGAAIVPGFSRSGLTIGGALLLGWKRQKAARFSFLLSIPAILGASFFQLQKSEISAQPWGLIILGVIIAALTGYLSLVFLVKVINRGQFFLFSYYCAAAAVLGIIFTM